MQVPGYRIESLIHQTARSSIYRAVAADGMRVVIKTPTSDNPTPRELAGFQWAYDLACEADERAIVRHIELRRVGASVALIMQDAGGVALAKLVAGQRLALPRWLDLCGAIATALGRLHETGIVHRDVNPHNLLLMEATSEVRLIDLGLAIRLRRMALGTQSAQQIEGTLAYMSPEQCGRIDAPVDQRSDLYSLGVTLFELACGRRPFEYAAASEMAHAHVARPAPSLRSLREDFPQVVSDMVAHLLAKNADARYASAQSLAHDLAHCAAELRRSGAVRAFVIGQVDASSSFRIASRLYGRESEQRQMREALASAALGHRVLVTVGGISGIGKTALVNDLQRHVAATQGVCCSGKFDQFQTEPYLGLLKALRGLLRLQLAEPEAQLAPRRLALQAALGIHGQILTRVLPELHAIVGDQPPATEVPPRDAERRLHLLVGRVLAVFATPQQPLVMFIDDLQWADPPSLQLIEALAADPQLAHLLLVVGLRSNEVGPGHPVHASLASVASAVQVTLPLALGPLQAGDVRQLLADTLRAEPGDVQALAQQIHGVAAGNPFFVGEFLHALRERGFFRHDPARNAWTWDLARLPDYALPDNVAALVTQRLGELPATCLDLLDTASCVGSEFDLRTLARVHEVEQSAAAAALAPAIRCGVIVPLDAHYKVFESLREWPLTAASAAELGTAHYRFQHDRVRQTVHERLDDERRSQRHLLIGRLLVKNLSEEELEQRLVEVFGHIAFGAHQLDDAAERAQLARLGLRAGVRAHAGLAFDTARRLLQTASSLLAPAAWRDDYDTAYGIHLAQAHCAFALTRIEEFEASSALVIEHGRTALERADIHGLRLRVRHTQNRFALAVDIAVKEAASLGTVLPRKPRLPHVLWGVVQTLALQRGRDPRDFNQLGAATDPKIHATVSLLTSASNPAYFAEPNLLPLIGMACTRLSIQHGMSPQSAYGFAVWALVLCGVLGHIENGYRFGTLALEVGKRYGGADEARARFVVDAFVRHWKEPLPDVARLLHTDWAYNRDSGDSQNATYCAGVLLYTHFLAGGSLDAQERYADSIAYLVGCELLDAKHSFLAWVELFAALRSPALPDALEGTWFSMADRMPEFEGVSNFVQIAISALAAGILDHLAGRLNQAEARFATAARYEENILGQVLVPGLAFFRALNAYRRVADGLADKSVLKMARKQRGRIKVWAKFAPFNLDHRLGLLDAEEALARGQVAQAILLLHRVVQQAAAGALFYQALAWQRLASVLHAQGAQHSGAQAAAAASACFMQWGSPALAASVPGWVPARDASTRTASTRSGSGDTGHLGGTDLQHVFNAMAAIASETDEQALLARLMPALMQAAGADRALLLLEDAQGTLGIEAEASLEGTTCDRTALDGYARVSRRAVDLALRASEPVLIDDAADAPLLANESHAREAGVASILALAIALQGRTIGVLYLENHLARNAFAAQRVEVTQALAAQVGIALDNARLHARVQNALTAQTALANANRRFVPEQFLSGLGFNSIAEVNLNEAIEREMNVLFVDLRGFTQLSLRLGARGTVAMINRYLSHVQPGIAAHGGFVGQYYGDGVLALFPGDSDSALRGAVAMCRGLEGYNRSRGDEFPELHFGMGLHSGPLTLGTIGDPDHFQCCVVGDSVNLASRMEGLTKHFCATLVVSEATARQVRAREEFGLRALGCVEVAGRGQPLDVFECVGCYPESVQLQIASTSAAYARALAAYRVGAWADALDAFDACAAACASDAVVRAFARRCRERAGQAFLWDGVERPLKA